MNVAKIRAHTATGREQQEQQRESAEAKTKAKAAKNKEAKKKAADKVWPKTWKVNYPWLARTFDDKALCLICEEYSSEVRKGNFAANGSTDLRPGAFSRHEKDTQEHLNSLRNQAAEQTLRNTLYKGGDAHTAMKSCFRMVYWLAKERLAHGKYPSLRKLFRANNCPLLDELDARGNATYTSKRFILEIQEAFSDVIDKNLLEKFILPAPAVGLSTDTAMDVGTRDQMSFYWRAVDPKTGRPRDIFGGLERVEDGTADGETRLMNQFLVSKRVPVEKVMSLGLDGASVGMGKLNGVGTQFQKQNPRMIVAHGAAHNLALAVKHAAKEVHFFTSSAQLLDAAFVSEHV
jgi:hypothetical protein